MSAQQQPPPEPDGETATQVDEAAAAALAGLEDRWRRAVADLDNLRKRYARELERERAAERARVAAQFLPVLDNLDRALAHAGGDPGTIVEGVRAVREEALAALTRLGFPRYEEVGVPFDPNRHEAISVEETDAAPDRTVLDVARSGYARDDRVLRPAQVIVARAPQDREG